MTSSTIEIFDASEAANDADWIAIMDQIGDEAGYFETLGPNHHAFLNDQGRILLVSFESMAAIRRAGGGQMPLGYQLAAPRGWSSLTIIAKGETWFRDPTLHGYFDRLIDDGFFEDFDRVVFYGMGMGAYAAAAYAVAAPGCTVLALSPIATLDTEHAGWDRRFPAARRLNFTDRFGFGPDMVEGCGKVFIVYDPANQIESVHAAMFRGAQVTRLPARHVGRDPQAELAQLAILRPLIEAACTGQLDRLRFARLWRKRRDSARYLRRMLGALRTQGKPARFLRALRVASGLSSDPVLKEALARAQVEAAAAAKP